MADDKVDPKVREIRERFDKGTSDIRDLQARAWETRAFLAGAQWMQWDRSFERLIEAPRNPDRVRATVNRIGPDSRRIIAKLTSTPLQFNVIPDSPDDAARRGAALAESILNDTHREQDWEHIRAEHAWAAWEGGTALLAVDWDKSAGQPIGDDKGTGTGEVCVSPISITEAATVPGTRDIRYAPWWVRAAAVPPEEAKLTYNLSKLPSADAKAMSTYSTRSLSAGRQQADKGDLAMVLTYYERPSHANPKGRVVTVVGNDIVEETDWPFPFTDRLNLAIARVVQVPGRWAGHAVAWDAIGVQTLYNASWSSIIEHQKLAGNARLAYPTGSIDDPRSLTDTPGEGLEYNPMNGEKPSWMAPPQLPAWVLDSPDRLRQELDDILGVHEVSRGVAPRNIESGVGLSILDENDQTPIGAYARELASCWSDVARMALRLYEDKVSERRTARVYTPGMPPELVKWNGKSLQGQTQAIVPTDTFTPMTRAAKLQFAFQLHDRFREVPGFDVNAVARLADLNQTIDLVEAVDPQTARAQRENYHLAQGTPVLVYEEDDDALHVKVHNDFILSERFENLDAETQKLIRLHRQAHQVAMAEKAGEQEAAARVGPTFGQVPTGNPSPLDQSQVLPGGPEPGVDVTPEMLAAAGEIPPDALLGLEAGFDPMAADAALPPEEPPLV